jgi:hypothetical protein
VPLLLLDTNVPENEPAERNVTDVLYGGDSELRIRQELLLGMGGVRALERGQVGEVGYTLRGPADGPERVALLPRDLGRVGAAAPLELQVLANRFVQQSHLG